MYNSKRFICDVLFTEFLQASKDLVPVVLFPVLPFSWAHGGSKDDRIS